MAFAEDLSPFFDTDGFAVEATVGAATINVIFDRAHIAALTGLAGGIDGTQPMALAQSSDVTAQSIARDTALVIGGTTYYVTSIQPDGTGVSLLVLSLESLP